MRSLTSSLEVTTAEKEVEPSIPVSEAVIAEKEVEPSVPISETVSLEADILSQEDTAL